MEKLTVIECARDPNGDGDVFAVLLSNGEVKTATQPFGVGVEWVEPAAAQDPSSDKDVEIAKLRLDNAMLARGLDDANVAIASMSTEISALKAELGRQDDANRVAPIPKSLTNVMTRDVADLPPLASLPPAPTMPEEPGKGPLSDEEEVERHLAAKALGKQIVEVIEEARSSEGTKA